MNRPGWLFDVDPRTVRLFVVGDVVAILAFVVAGELSHGRPLALGRVAGVAVPFLVGWALVGTAVGVYGRGVRASAPRLVVATTIGWLGADAVGQAIRATAAFPGDAATTFFLVAFGVTLLLLLVWRLPLLLLVR